MRFTQMAIIMASQMEQMVLLMDTDKALSLTSLLRERRTGRGMKLRY